MSVLVPPLSPIIGLELQLEAFATGRPVPILEYRHTPLHPSAQVLAVVGLTGENAPVGFSLGDVGSDVPHTVVVCGDPRDPALAVRAGAALADALDPLVAAEVGGAGPMQLLVDGSNTVDFLHSTTFRTRQPWLPGPYAADPGLIADADRCGDGHAVLRAILTAAKIPGADIVVDAVGLLTTHLMFPLAGQQEGQQLPVLLACLREAGAPVNLAALPAVPGGLLAQIEAAETVTVSAAADPDWDNKNLVPALSSFKRIRNQRSGGNQLMRVDRILVERAARDSGLTATVTAQLTMRHAAIAQAFRIVQAIPPLPGLAARRAAVAWRVGGQLQRGARHERAWADFPALPSSARDADENQKVTAAALLAAARDDRRVFALAAARGEATQARVLSVSADGRIIELELTAPLAPRKQPGWQWLDDTHSETVRGNLQVLPGNALRARLTVTRQMRRLAKQPQLLTAPATIRLTCLEEPFGGRAWWPRRTVPAVIGTGALPAPIDFAALDAPRTP